MYRTLLLLLGLAGCTLATEQPTTDGSHQYQITAAPTAPWSMHESRARSFCPDGFTVISRHVTMFELSEMVVRCKEPS